MAEEVIHLSGTVVVNGETELKDLWIERGLIRLEKPLRSPDRHVDGVVLPGLVDVHCHIGMGAEGGIEPAAAAAQAVTVRNTGVLLVRDAGCPRQPYSTRWMDHDPAMPRLIRSGQHLAKVKRYLPNLPRNVEDDELEQAAIEEAQAGDGWIKLVGDWIDRSMAEPDLALLWSDEALRAAVDAVHQLGARVTTHVFSYEGAAQALRCGVDCIEHGTGMDEDLMAQAVGQGVPVTPTMMQRRNFAAIADAGKGKFPVWEAHMRRLYEDRLTQAKALHDAGVRLLVGGDESASTHHGHIGRECALMVTAGIPAPVVVGAASWDARDFLGAPGISDGAPADLVVYAADPRGDIGQLATPRAVILRGEQVAGSYGQAQRFAAV